MYPGLYQVKKGARDKTDQTRPSSSVCSEGRERGCVGAAGGGSDGHITVPMGPKDGAGDAGGLGLAPG